MIDKEDYEEPRCVLCNKDEKKSIPVMRISEKLDEYFYKGEFDNAKGLLKYWYDEAEQCNDLRGKLFVCNEYIGLGRKLDSKEDAFFYAEQALSLLDELQLKDTATYGTTLINIATAYKAFGETEKSIPLYESALLCYKEVLDKNDCRFGGLYNNMAIALMDVGEFRRSEEFYFLALSVVKNIKNGEGEVAVTYCNLANLYELENGLEWATNKIKEQMNNAKSALESCTLKDGNYAYVCSKCAPCFEYYGFKEYASELRKRAKEIYERY